MGQYVPPPGLGRPPVHASAPATTPRFARQQEKMLARLQPLLGRAMEPGERILVATRACAPYTALEFVTTGWIVVIVKRCVLVFTDRRILHVPTTRGYASRESLAQIRYGDIAKISFSSLLGSAVKLVYRSGRKETFSGIGRKELRVIQAGVPALIGTGAKTEAAGRHHLCPRCRARLVPDRFECPGCRLEFKSSARARRLSILAPGGGYFYTRHPIMGVFDAIVELYLIVFVLLALVLAFTGETSEDTAAGWVMLAFIGFALLIEKAVSIYHAGHFVKEYLPVDMKIGPPPPVPIPSMI